MKGVIFYGLLIDYDDNYCRSNGGHACCSGTGGVWSSKLDSVWRCIYLRNLYLLAGKKTQKTEMRGPLGFSFSF